MKKFIYLTLLIFGCITMYGQSGNSDPRSSVNKNIITGAIPFKLDQVALLDSPFKNAQELDKKWLLSLEPNRFLSRFLKNAGLTPKDSVYGGWESLGVGGKL